MKVIIIGAGIVGITSAYHLLKKGHEVTLIDQYSHAGMGTSFANGGQLSYQYLTPIATPNVLRQLPKILCGLDPSFKISLPLDMNFYLWGLRFLLQCSPKRSLHSSKVMQALSSYSRGSLLRMIADTNIHFDHRSSSGKLYIYQN